MSDRMTELKKEFIDYLEDNLFNDWDYSSHDTFIDDNDISDEEWKLLSKCTFEVVEKTKPVEFVITDPTKNGEIEFNGENLVRSIVLDKKPQDVLISNDYNFYIDGVKQNE